MQAREPEAALEELAFCELEETFWLEELAFWELLLETLFEEELAFWLEEEETFLELEETATEEFPEDSQAPRLVQA